jgi:hypothetical protein
MQQSPGNRAVPGLTQHYRPSAGARRDLVPILLGVLAQLYMPLAAYRKRDRLADGRCHTPPRLACARTKRRRGPEQQKSQSRVHTGTFSVIAPVTTLRAIRLGNKRRSGSLEAQPLGRQVQPMRVAWHALGWSAWRRQHRLERRGRARPPWCRSS